MSPLPDAVRGPRPPSLGLFFPEEKAGVNFRPHLNVTRIAPSIPIGRVIPSSPSTRTWVPAKTLAEDPPPVAKPPDAPAPKRRRQAAEPTVSAKLPLARTRRRVGVRVSTNTDRRSMAAAPFPETAGGGGAGRGSFRAGDLVWAKFKIRAWWPGKVLDPTEYAGEIKRHGGGQSVLVAPFGDAAVAWFDPSQLKPFEEQFRQMLKQSSSPSFVYAVKDALVETEKQLGSEMSCYCSAASNSEVAQRVGKRTVAKYSPAQFHERLLDAARDVLGTDMLEVVLLRCWASTLRCVIQCPADLLEKDYPDDPLHGPASDDTEVESEVGYNRSGRGPGTSEVSQQKERSIAELIADKGSEIAEPHRSMVKVASFHELSPSSSSDSQEQKKKGDKSKSSEVRNGVLRVQEETAILMDRPDPSVSTDKQASKGEKNRSSGVKNDGIVAEPETRSSGRERKRSKYLSPPYTYISAYHKRPVSFNYEPTENLNRDPEVSQSSFTGSPQNIGNINQDSKNEDGKPGSVSDHDRSSTSGILSVFLSAAIDPLSRKWSQSANVVTDLLDKFRSFVYSDGSDFHNYQKLLDDLGSNGELSMEDYMNDSSGIDGTDAKKNKRVTLVGVKTPNGHIPTEPGKVQKRRKIKHSDGEADAETSMATENSSANGTKLVNYARERKISKGNSISAKIKFDLHHELRCNAEGSKLRERTNKGKDTTAAETRLDTLTGLAGQSEPNKLGRRNKGKSGSKPESASEMEHKPTSSSEGERSKKKKGETKCETPAYLLLEFAPGTALPSKGDIISRFSMYGPLVKPDTEILQGSHCIRVAFKRGLDAEKALKDLDSSGSLESSVTKRELHYFSGNISSQLQTSTVLKTPLPYIRKSLERMISKLTEFMEAEKDVGSSNVLKPEITDNLVDEMDGLLKKVNKLLTGPSVST
ncbi:hypothetical protein B296_00011069 [Ensete ventricosum]|uniref:PWWP domain-containing protein n=1 Tax=Ensete ventricosum TaxID=4639 RepID=A0A426ZW49_ENSVE|nr:hypothetical protein B296_00011069 [Ensete ventricosum]